MAALHLRMLTNAVFEFIVDAFKIKISKVVGIPLLLHTLGNLLILQMTHVQSPIAALQLFGNFKKLLYLAIRRMLCLLRIDCYFFCFIGVWMKKKRRAHCMVILECACHFFIHTSVKQKESTVSSYNLISNHVHAEFKGKQFLNKAKFKLIQKHNNKLQRSWRNDYLTPSCHLWKYPKCSNTGSSNCFHLSSIIAISMHFFIFGSNATIVMLFTMM